MGIIFSSARPWAQQYHFNTSSISDVTGWASGTAIPEAKYGATALATQNRVYLIGGYGVSGVTKTVHTAPINSDGTLGTWVAGTSIPGELYSSSLIVTKNRVHLLGGLNNSATTIATVYTAPINTDGTLGAWTTGGSLPAAVRLSQAVVTKNRAYILGGYVGTSYVDVVYTAEINDDGTLEAWTTATSLPAALIPGAAITTSNRVYLFGGQNSAGTALDTVYTAPINDDGTIGTWATGTSLPGVKASSHAVVTRGRVFLLGGETNNVVSTTVYTAPINEDGTVGTWTTGTVMSAAFRLAQPIVTSSKVYLIGGYTTAISTAVYVADFTGGQNDYLEDSYYYADGSVVGAITFAGTVTGAVIHRAEISGSISYGGTVTANTENYAAVVGTISYAGTVTAQSYDANTAQGVISYSGTVSAYQQGDIAISGVIAYGGSVAASSLQSASVVGSISYSGQATAMSHSVSAVGQISYGGEVTARTPGNIMATGIISYSGIVSGMSWRTALIRDHSCALPSHSSSRWV